MLLNELHPGPRNTKVIGVGANPQLPGKIQSSCPYINVIFK